MKFSREILMKLPLSQKNDFIGEMAEWFKAHAWKVCVLLKVPRVRIPVSPPKKIKNRLKKELIDPFFVD